MIKTTSRTDQHGQRVVVRANKLSVSLGLRYQFHGPAQLNSQQARDIAHALLRGARLVDDASPTQLTTAESDRVDEILVRRGVTVMDEKPC